MSDEPVTPDIIEDEGTWGVYEHRAATAMTLEEVMGNYEIVSAASDDPVNGHSAYIVVAERGYNEVGNTLAATDTALRELGYTSPSPWTTWTREDENVGLRDKQGIKKYMQMKRSDGMVRGALRGVKTPITGAHWFVKPGGKSTRDVNAAKFIEKTLFENLNVPWACVLEDILLMLDYGYMAFEKVYDPIPDENGRIGLKKLAPRHPLDIQEWDWDAQGGPNGIVLEPNPMTPGNEPIAIPIKKLAVFYHEGEAGDLRGLSLLRSVYKHWYYKDTLYKIDAIQKERHGIGVPIIKLPPNFTAEDKRIAENLGRNLRTNERAHVTLPPMWELGFAELKGHPVDCLKSVDHHNMMIMATILAPFLTEAKTDPKSLDLFYKSTRYIAAAICEIVNRYIIRDLIDINFSRVKYPKLTVRRIGEWEDIRTMTFALRNLVGANIIKPDDPLEHYMREELDMPEADPETAREPKAVQGPTPPGGGNANPESKDSNKPGGPSNVQAGLPRQTKPSTTPPRKNGGRDSSGG